MEAPWSDEELNDDLFDDDEDDNDHYMDDDDDMESVSPPPPATYSVYRRKYNLLLERVRAIQQDNELLVSRVQEVTKLKTLGLRQRKALILRLDTHGDNFRNVPIVMPPEEDTTGGKKGKEKRLKKGGSLDESGTPSKGRKGRRDKEKIARDPNLPKRPQNPFFQFCKEKRETVAKDVFTSQGVNLTKKELTKILANQWNSLDLNAKQVYNQRFEAEKAGYTVKMEVYRKLKDESEQTQAAIQGHTSAANNSFIPNFDYEASFD